MNLCVTSIGRSRLTRLLVICALASASFAIAQAPAASQPSTPDAGGAKLRINPSDSQAPAASPQPGSATNDSVSGAKLRLGAPPTPPRTAPSPPQAAPDSNQAAITEPVTLPTPEGLADYDGTMDAGRIRLTLVTKADGSVTGSYFLPPSFSDIKVEGRMIDAQSLSLREVRGDAGQDGSIYLKKTASSNSDGLAGTWASHDGKTSLSISLQLDDALPGATSVDSRYSVSSAEAAAAALEKNAQAFYAAVLANDPQQAAAAVSFPLAYTLNGRRTLLHTPSDFIAKFSTIFTPEFVAEIRATTPHQMAANDQGVMLGAGLVWFNQDGKAFALNNQPVKMFAGKHFLTNAGWKGAANLSSAPNSKAAKTSAASNSKTELTAATTPKTAATSAADSTTKQTATSGSKTRRRRHGKRSKAAPATPGQ